MLSRPGKIKKYIPNFLSFFRLFSSPFFLVLLKDNDEIYVVLFLVLIAITDFLDGYLARKFSTVSKIGEILDPFADKIFLNFIIWGIYYFKIQTVQILILAILLTLRDMVLISGGIFSIAKKIKRELRPIMLSKICTAVAFILCAVSIIAPISKIQVILSNVTIILVVITSYIYVKRFLTT